MMDDLIKKKGGRPKGALTIPLAINTQKTKAVEYTLEGLEKLFQSLEKELNFFQRKAICNNNGDFQSIIDDVFAAEQLARKARHDFRRMINAQWVEENG
jgi:hypothetical protein|tara:strand:- start:140 stop:436 length:297 start_codon:yes stop_codon:yes gene_type:complete